MPNQPRTAKESTPTLGGNIPSAQPPDGKIPLAESPENVANVLSDPAIGRAIWLLQTSTGRWDPSTPIPSTLSPPAQGNSELGSASSGPSAAGAAPLLPGLPADWTQNRRSTNLSAPTQLPVTPSADAIRALLASGVVPTLGRPAPAGPATAAGVDTSAVQSAITAATAMNPAPPAPDQSPTTWPQAPSAVQLPLLLDATGAPPSFDITQMPLVPSDAQNQNLGFQLASDSTSFGSAVPQSTAADARTARQIDRLFGRFTPPADALLQGPPAAPRSPGLLDLLDQLKHPQRTLPSFADDSSVLLAANDDSATGTPTDDASSAADGLSNGPAPPLVVELANTDEKLLNAIRAAPAQFNAAMVELIRSEITGQSIVRRTQRYGSQ